LGNHGREIDDKAREGKGEKAMSRNPVLDVPLTQVIRQDISLPLQHLKVFTVGGLLMAWRNPKSQKHIEQFFESPEQARHAVSVCATFLGVQSHFVTGDVQQWWAADASVSAASN
jgi:hypothetical protein